MKAIGRKIYINCGDHIIAIEKYAKNEFFEEAQLNNQAISIFDIKECCGAKMESFVGRPAAEKCYGQKIDEYLSNKEFWATEEEFDNLNNHKLKQSNNFIKELPNTKEYKEKINQILSHKLLNTEDYNYCLKSGIKVAVHDTRDDDCSESFWGIIIDEKSYETYKNVNNSELMLIVATNNTLSGIKVGEIIMVELKNGMIKVI